MFIRRSCKNEEKENGERNEIKNRKNGRKERGNERGKNCNPYKEENVKEIVEEEEEKRKKEIIKKVEGNIFGGKKIGKGKTSASIVMCCIHYFRFFYIPNYNISASKKSAFFYFCFLVFFLTMFGTMLGCLIIAVLRNGFTLLSIDSAVQNMVLGLVIIGAVLMDVMRQASEAKKRRLAAK